MTPPLILSPLQVAYLFFKKKKLLTTPELHQNIAILQLINKMPLCSKDCARCREFNKTFLKEATVLLGKSHKWIQGGRGVVPSIQEEGGRLRTYIRPSHRGSIPGLQRKEDFLCNLITIGNLYFHR